MVFLTHETLIDTFSHLKKNIEQVSKVKKLNMEQHFYKTYKLSELFLEEYQNSINWNMLFKFQKLSETIIETYRKKITDWYTIITHQTLSESFIKKHIDKFDCHFIAKYQTLSDDFIDEYFGDSTWAWKELSEFQSLSIHIILKHANKIDIESLKKNKLINQKELEEKQIYTMIKLMQNQ